MDRASLLTPAVRVGRLYTRLANEATYVHVDALSRERGDGAERRGGPSVSALARVARIALTLAWPATVTFIAAGSSCAAASPILRTRFEDRLARADSLFSHRQPDASLRLLDSLLSASRREGETPQEVQALLAQARLNGILGRPGPCRPAASAALRLAESQRDSLSACAALRWLAVSAQMEGRMLESRVPAQKLLRLAAARGDRFHEGHGNLLLAYADLTTGDLAAAEPRYRRAARLFHETGEVRFELMAYTGLGRLSEGRGDIDEARECYTRVLDGSRAIRNPYSEADALNNLGGLEFSYGDPSAAREYYRQALDLQLRSGNRAGSVVPAKNLALTHTYMGEFEEAVALLNEALRTCDDLGYRAEEGIVLEQLADVRREQRRFDESADLLRRVVAHMPAESPDYRGQALLSLAETLQYKDSLGTALAILEERFEPVRPLLSPPLRFRDERIRGEILIRSGRVAEALEHFRRADGIGRTLGSTFRVSPLAYAARCHDLMGRPDSARIYLRRAAETWEAERMRASDPGWREQLDIDGRFLHTEIARQALSDARPESLDRRARFAFDSIQRFKARTMRERMRGPFPARVDPAESPGPVTAAERPPGPVTAAELQERWLDPDELLLDVFLGTDGIYLFAVSRSEFRARKIPGDPDPTNSRLRRYRELILDRSSGARSESESQLLTQAGDQLASLLFASVADLMRTHERIVFALDGLLNTIPVESLPLASSEGGTPEPLLEWRKASRTPSATILRDSREEAREGARGPVPQSRPILALLSVPGPDGNEDSGAFGEVAWLHRSFRDVEIRSATPDSAGSGWKRDLCGSDVIHLASHVLVDDIHPWRSGLPYLRAQEIARMRLPARLAVLAGCESAGGRVVSGEGVLGLSAAFTVASVPSVIATLWPVSDRATARLMKAFYSGLSSGMPVADALRHAQVEIRRRPGTRDPFYWSGFILVGEGGTAVRLQERSLARLGRRPALTLAVMAAIAFAAGLLIVRAGTRRGKVVIRSARMTPSR